MVTNLVLGFSFFLFFSCSSCYDGWMDNCGRHKEKEMERGGIRYTGSVDSIIFLSFAALCGE